MMNKFEGKEKISRNRLWFFICILEFPIFELLVVDEQ